MASFLILSFLLTEAAAGLLVDVGGTAVLDCNDSRTPIRAVEWIKEGRPPKFILFYSDGHLDPDHQHSTFKDRVELVDLQHKGGDLSLRLKDVVLSDAGTYQCLVAAGPSRRSKRAFIKDKPVATIQLEVRDSDNGNSVNNTVNNTVNNNTKNNNTKNNNTVNNNTKNNNTKNNNTKNKYVLHPVVLSVVCVALLLAVVGAVVFGHGVYKRRLVKRSDEDEAVNHHFIKHSLEQQNLVSLA